MGVWSARIVLDRRKQLCGRFLKPSDQEICETQDQKWVRKVVARIEAERDLDILDRGIGLPGPYFEYSSHIPAATEARVESEDAIGNRYHGPDVLAETG